MQQVDQNMLIGPIANVLESFCAEEWYDDEASIILSGPHLLHIYENPEEGVMQGALFTFDSDSRPRVAMTIEKTGARLLVRLARLTSDKLIVYYSDQIFSDLENNYVEQFI
jgi:hypothetical protein